MVNTPLDGFTSVSGRLSRLGDKTIFKCAEFPVQGIGNGGLGALPNFLASLVAHTKRSDVQNQLLANIPAERVRQEYEIRFELFSVTTKDHLSGKVIGAYGNGFLGSVDQLPVQCANTTAFGTLTHLLKEVRAHFRRQEHSTHLGARIRGSLNNGDEVRFWLGSDDLAYCILQEAHLSKA